MVETFYDAEELTSLGLRKFGKNVRISRKTSIYHPEKVSLGDDVQIADFCIMSGMVDIGSHVHLGAYTAIYGQNGVRIG
ncbi:MAG: acyltransferase, partial [Methanomassiliicoccus sp.]